MRIRFLRGRSCLLPSFFLATLKVSAQDAPANAFFAIASLTKMR
jgi:hypothetical protein